MRRWIVSMRCQEQLNYGRRSAEWGIGLSNASCFHAWILGGPPRLVIDVQH